MLLATLILTITIEGLVLWLWWRAAVKRGENYPFLPLLVSLTAANLITQILLYVILIIPGNGYWRTLLMVECVILGLEAAALIAARLPLRLAIRVSLLVNLISFLIGLLVPA